MSEPRPIVHALYHWQLAKALATAACARLDAFTDYPLAPVSRSDLVAAVRAADDTERAEVKARADLYAVLNAEMGRFPR